MKEHVPRNEFGVSLSGGGYRASAFHLGTLRALHKMNLLSKIDILSTISGGSITGAAYCLHNGSYEEFENYMVEQISTKNVVRHILLSWSFFQLILFTLLFQGTAIYFLFTSHAWLYLPLFALWLIILLRYQFIIFPTGKEVERAYDKFYYHGATLKALCEKPVLAIGSSNLQTGRPFTFSYRKMNDSTYSAYKPPVEFRQEEFPIARAVMASSCVPFAFTPVSIDKKFFKNEEDAERIDPKLVDGGVYDNQGIHKLTQKNSSYECRNVLTSDAGGKLSFEGKYNNTLTLLIRTVDLFMNRIKTSQMVEDIYGNVESGLNRQIAYLSLGWDLDKCIPGFFTNLVKGYITKEVLDAHAFPKEWLENPAAFEKEIINHLEARVGYAAIKARDLNADELKYIRSTGTNLTPLEKQRILLLARHAENLTELQVKLYCPKILAYA